MSSFCVLMQAHGIIALCKIFLLDTVNQPSAIYSICFTLDQNKIQNSYPLVLDEGNTIYLECLWFFFLYFCWNKTNKIQTVYIFTVWLVTELVSKMFINQLVAIDSIPLCMCWIENQKLKWEGDKRRNSLII